MRDILFRGKRVDNEKWVYGIPVETETEGGIKTFIFTHAKWKSDDNSIDFLETDVYEITSKTVGQYTGLTDKNGTKIFEGDILRFYNGEEFSNYEVIWFGNAYKVLMEGETEIQDDLDLFFCEHSEVIGNIHDKPELLEVNNE